MGVVGKAVLAKSTSMRLIRFITALVVVAQQFAFLARQQILRQLVAVAVVVMAAHPTVAVAVDPRESRVVQVTVVAVVLILQEEHGGILLDRMAPPERHFSVDVAMTRAAAAAAAGLVVAAAETTLVVEVAPVMFCC
jgi:hypothetical protein